MHAGGAVVNHTTRFEDPVAGGHAGLAAIVVSGWVVGVGNVVGGIVVVVDVDVELDVEVDVVVDAFFLPVPFTRKTMSTIKAARITKLTPRRVFRRRFLPFSMMACFCSRAARWRALFSLGTERHATETQG